MTDIVRWKETDSPKVLCIDEIYFSGKRRKKYVLVLLNFFNRAIIDILKDRDKHTIAAYLSKIPRQERDSVEYISIDMNDNYRDVLKVYLRNAAIVADSFHVIKRVNKLLDDKRRRIMRRFEDNKSSDEYYLLKYRDQLLFTKSLSYDRTMNHHFRYYISENELLGMILKINPELESSYHLVQKYILFNDHDYSGDLKAARNDLEELIIEYKLSGISGFPELAATLEYWKDEIINSFSILRGQRVSNGPIEGRNSLIKKVLHLANGYSNFDRFRNRIIYSLNKYATHSFRADDCKKIDLFSRSIYSFLAMTHTLVHPVTHMVFQPGISFTHTLVHITEYYAPCMDDHSEAYRVRGVYTTVRGAVQEVDPCRQTVRVQDRDVPFRDIYRISMISGRDDHK